MGCPTAAAGIYKQQCTAHSNPSLQKDYNEETNQMKGKCVGISLPLDVTLLSPLLFSHLNYPCFHCCHLCQIILYIPKHLSIILASCPLCFKLTHSFLCTMYPINDVLFDFYLSYCSSLNMLWNVEKIEWDMKLAKQLAHHIVWLGVVGHCICMAGTSLNFKVYITFYQDNINEIIIIYNIYMNLQCIYNANTCFGNLN